MGVLAPGAFELALLRRIAAEALILLDDAGVLLHKIRAREPLAGWQRAAGGSLAGSSHSPPRCPASQGPHHREYGAGLRRILDYHALMLTCSVDLLAVPWRSQRLEDGIDRIAGLGRPARWLGDLRFELRVAS